MVAEIVSITTTELLSAFDLIQKNFKSRLIEQQLLWYYLINIH